MEIVIVGTESKVKRLLTSYFLDELRAHVVQVEQARLVGAFSDSMRQVFLSCDVVVVILDREFVNEYSFFTRRCSFSYQIDVMRQVKKYIAVNELKPSLVIAVSSVDYYPVSGCFDEYTGVRGESLLSDLCYEWELEAKQGLSDYTRLVILRLANNLVYESKDCGSLLKRMHALAAVWGIKCRKRFWISAFDFCRSIDLILSDNSVSGVYNLLAPEDLTSLKKRVVLPKRFLESGFGFLYTKLEELV